MKRSLAMSLMLSSNQYHAGLMEIRRQFESRRSDDYLSGLVDDLAKTDKALLNAMHVDRVKRHVKEESRQLNERLVAASRYVDSCSYVSDEAMKASAEALKQLLAAYDKPFVRMRVDERVGAVSTLLRDLHQPANQVHVDRLPEMTDRVKGVEEAWESLKGALHEVDKTNGTTPKGQTMRFLKREAGEKLTTLVTYLQAMSVKDPAVYAEDYNVVTEIIKRINATRRKASRRIEEPTLTTVPSLVASA